MTLRELLRALRLFVDRRSVERELDDELRFHLEMETRRNIERGMSPAEARALAEREFGGVARVKTEIETVHSARGVPLADSIATDARYTLRSLRLSPGFTMGAIATLALGIGANVTMFAILEHLLLRPPAHVVDPENVLIVQRFLPSKTGQSFTIGTFSYPRFKALRDAMTGAELATADFPREIPYGRGAEAKSVVGTLVSGNYFAVMGAQPQIGRFFSADEDHEPVGDPVVVISDGLWKREFGHDRNVLGKTMELGPRRFTIIGVAPPQFTGMHTKSPDLWIPISSAVGLQFPGSDWATTKNSTWVSVVARIKPGATLQQLATQSDIGVLASADPHAKLTTKPVLQPLPSFLREQRGADAKVTVLLSFVSLLVLFIACANLANLLLARSLRRRREIAVRIALGASRARLATQIAVESLVLALVGGAAALLLAHWGGALLAHELFSDAVWVDSPVDLRVVSYSIGIAIAAGLIAAVVPAFQMSRPNLSMALKVGAHGEGERARTRNILLVLQATFSVLLLVGAGLFVRSLRNVTSLDLGMDPEHALLVTMDLKKLGMPLAEINDLYVRMAERVREMPGIDKAAVAVTVPSYHSYGTAVKVAGLDSLPQPADGTYENGVEPDYFAAMGMRIVRGRAFTESDVRAGVRIAVINETLARAGWPGGDPIGRCIKIGADTAPCTTVIGVAADSRRQSLIEASNYHIHVPLAQTADWMNDRVLVVRAKGERTNALLRDIALTMQTTAPNLPFANVRPLSTRFAGELRPWRLGATMFGAFGVLALLLAGVGLYSVIAFAVARRTHELGVRMALGAEASTVLAMVVRQAVRLAVVGVVAGVALALAGGQFIEPLLFHTSPRDPLVFSAVAAVLLAVAVVAALGPAWRATRVDPVTALRTE